MLHEPAASPPDQEHAIDEKARLGVKLFIVYCLVYVGFVVVSTWKPKLMGAEILHGVNLAVIYGFGLIGLAIVMGLVYHLICSHQEDRAKRAADQRGARS